MNAFSPERAASRVVFNVMLVCEDFETGTKARQVYDYIAGHIGPGCEFSCELCRIGMPRSNGSVDAAAADIVILSLHGDRHPVREIESWIASWARHDRSRTHALVALFDREARGQRSPRTCLQRVARRAHKELVVESATLPQNRGRASPANLFWLL